ncbi:hypothetical protein C7S18_17245 [Ahniella affigens]|uniref:Uncharacterized protein n=1 Tax=Ahniella affigens TaxID=2021234 RepID=A0A2P1PVE6_9GAMM|nr:hypothetical protein [Ahniella affigens]AVP98818.1 hypothetical protein C7S18_17245 [Ahniella affigens]
MIHHCDANEMSASTRPRVDWSRWLLALLFGSLLIGIGSVSANDLFADSLEPLNHAEIRWQSDEFDDARSLSRFDQIWRTEHWPFDSAEIRDVNQTTPGHLTLQPYSSGWWEDYRAELTYKTFHGDLQVTTLVRPRNRAGLAAPGSTHGGPLESEYSLAGLMLRVPRPEVEASNNNWTRGREAYVFLSMGAADTPGLYQFEDKTTRAALPGETHSVSVRIITNAPANTDSAYLRLVRIGPHVLALFRPTQPGANWQVLRRFRRNDFSPALQVGMVAYTDWATMSACSYEFHNINRLQFSCANPAIPADPDLRASFDFFRLQRPDVPSDLTGADWSNPAAVPNAVILQVFGTEP